MQRRALSPSKRRPTNWLVSVPAPEIDPAETWVTSDSHWGHDNIVRYCNRPDNHFDVMVDRWREEVPAEATVLHLGDLSYRSNALFKHVTSAKLTGTRKLLILGNHDRQRPSFYRDCGFKVVKPFEIPYGDWVVSFSHYALREPAPERHVHVHGHIHNNGYGGRASPYVPFSVGQINVSVEQTHYRPVNLKLLLDGFIDGCYEPNGDLS